TDPSTTARMAEILDAARNYFDKGRCSGHAQFNGRYCRDAADSTRWCIHCAGFMLLSLVQQQATDLAHMIEPLKASDDPEEAEAVRMTAEYVLMTRQPFNQEAAM